MLTEFYPVKSLNLATFFAVFLIWGASYPAIGAIQVSPQHVLNPYAFSDSNRDREVTVKGAGDTLIACWYSESTTTPLSTPVITYVSRSIDGGSTWSNPAVLDGMGRGTTYVAHAGGNNWVIIDALAKLVTVSSNDGATWSYPQAVAGAVSFSYLNPMIESNGSGLVVAVVQSPGTSTPNNAIQSTDGGKTWTSGGTLPIGWVEDLVFCGGTNWLCAQFTETGYMLYISSDNGLTWTTRSLPAAFSAGQNFTISSDKAGTVLAMYAENSVSGDVTTYATYVARSTDYGATWTTPVAVHGGEFTATTGFTPGEVTSVHSPVWLGGDSWRLVVLNYAVRYDFLRQSLGLSILASRTGGKTWTAPESVPGAWPIPVDFPGYKVAGAQDKVVVGWTDRDVVLDGQNTGNDFDLLYQVISLPPAAALDWQLFE